MARFGAYVLISLLVGLICGFPGALAIMFMRGIFYLPFAKKKRIKEANAVTAKLDYGSIRSGSEMQDPVSAYYNYTVGDKNYRYKALAKRFNMEKEITLYYMPGNEAHAKNAHEFTGDQHVFLKSYVVAAIVFAALLFAIFVKRAG